MFGGYRLLERIGGGGMGDVWEAEEIALRRRVALKLLRPDLVADSRALERFRREALAAAHVQHSGVVAVYAVGRIGGQPFIAQEFVPGRRTLAKQRVLAGHQMLVRFDQGSIDPVDAVRERALVERLERLLPRHDAVIVSDYGYGVVTERLIVTLRAWQARRPRVLVVDSKSPLAFQGASVTAVKPNFEEALRLVGAAPPPGRTERIALIERHGPRMLELTGAQVVAAGLGHRARAVQCLVQAVQQQGDHQPRVVGRAAPPVAAVDGDEPGQVHPRHLRDQHPGRVLAGQRVPGV